MKTPKIKRMTVAIALMVLFMIAALVQRDIKTIEYFGEVKTKGAAVMAEYLENKHKGAIAFSYTYCPPYAKTGPWRFLVNYTVNGDDPGVTYFKLNPERDWEIDYTVPGHKRLDCDSPDTGKWP